MPRGYVIDCVDAGSFFERTVSTLDCIYERGPLHVAVLLGTGNARSLEMQNGD